MADERPKRKIPKKIGDGVLAHLLEGPPRSLGGGGQGCVVTGKSSVTTICHYSDNHRSAVTAMSL